MLTQFISHEQQVAEKAASDRTAGRALTAAEELTATGNKDPSKTTLDGKPKDPCPLCKKMGHWKSQCFQNPNADLETKRLALRIAPKSPAGQALAKVKAAEKKAATTTTTTGPEQKDEDAAAALAAARMDDVVVHLDSDE